MDLLISMWLIIDIATLAVFLGAKFRNVLPGFLVDLMVHGKTRPKPTNSQLHWCRQLLLVPNSWFMHFYALGLLWNVIFLATFLQSIVKQEIFHPLLAISNSGTSQVDCFSVMFTLVLLMIQTSRRLFECLFVNSFSGKMHLAHYAVGITFYFLVNLTIIAEVPRSQGCYESCLHPTQHISWWHIVATALFILASYHQYQCHTILGQLGAWTSDGKKIYKVPHGDWFDLVSSPHYLAEILIYIALFLAMKARSIRWIFLFTFVVLNLTLSAQNTHSWYTKKFEEYPKQRHIIIPYVY